MESVTFVSLFLKITPPYLAGLAHIQAEAVAHMVMSFRLAPALAEDLPRLTRAVAGQVLVERAGHSKRPKAKLFP